MNGTPFSAACKAACSAGQVASIILIVPPVMAAVKRGAGPNSPRLTALVSSVATQPAPISRSACRLEVGSATRCRPFTPRRISARVAAIGTPDTSRGTTSMQPSVDGASASSSDFAVETCLSITWLAQAAHFSHSYACKCPPDFADSHAQWKHMTLQEKLTPGVSCITAEVTPPVSADRGELLAKAMPLKGLADAVNITDGAGARPHLGALTAAAHAGRARHRADPADHLPRPQPHRLAKRSHERRGERRAQSADAARRRSSAGDQPDAKAVFDLDPRAACWRPRGGCATRANCRPGRKVSGRADFFLGAADNPVDPPPGWEPTSLAGQDRRRRAIRADAVLHGCGRRAPLSGAAGRAWHCRQTYRFSIGVVPLRSAKSARWIKEKLFGAIIPDALIARMETASDPAAEGRRICLDLVARACRTSRMSPAATSWRRTTMPPCRTSSARRARASSGWRGLGLKRAHGFEQIAHLSFRNIAGDEHQAALVVAVRPFFKLDRRMRQMLHELHHHRPLAAFDLEKAFYAQQIRRRAWPSASPWRARMPATAWRRRQSRQN